MLFLMHCISNLCEIVSVQFTEFVNNSSTKNVNFTQSVRLLKKNPVKNGQKKMTVRGKRQEKV